MAESVPWNTDCHRALGAVPMLCLDLALAAQHSAASSLQAPVCCAANILFVDLTGVSGSLCISELRSLGAQRGTMHLDH